MNNEFVSLKREGASGLIRMQWEEKRNALSPGMIAALKEAFGEAAKDDKIKVIILSGTAKAFSAGADLAYLKKMQGFSQEENLKDSRNLKALFEEIYTLPKLVIAQIKGPAIAGGCGLATVCDLLISTPESLFGYSEVRIGFIPAIVMTFLIRKIGESHAKRLLLTGERITGSEAHRIGLVNYLFPADCIETESKALAEKMAKQCSGEAIAMTKKLIAQVQDLSLPKALELAAKANAEARAGKDCVRGVTAFLNKEKINWNE